MSSALHATFARGFARSMVARAWNSRTRRWILLAKQPWPGNVRQLSNIVERLVVLADVDVIGSVEVERELGRRPLGAAPLPRPEEEEGGSLPWRRREAEKGAILHALARAGENRTLAARLLDVSRSTFYKKLREHGLD